MPEPKKHKKPIEILAETNPHVADFVNAKTWGVCPLCKQRVSPESFRDTISRKEYEISGLCQACQDDFFE